MHLTEYNAETPAGAAYGDALTEAFFALPVMRPFLRRFDVRPLPSRHGVLHALLGAYAQWDGGGGGKGRPRPRTPIPDWREGPAPNQFGLWGGSFRARGP